MPKYEVWVSGSVEEEDSIEVCAANAEEAEELGPSYLFFDDVYSSSATEIEGDCPEYDEDEDEEDE